MTELEALRVAAEAARRVYEHAFAYREMNEAGFARLEAAFKDLDRATSEQARDELTRQAQEQGLYPAAIGATVNVPAGMSVDIPSMMRQEGYRAGLVDAEQACARVAEYYNGRDATKADIAEKCVIAVQSLAPSATKEPTR